MNFSKWYKDKHGYTPFPWQKELAERIKNNKPPSCIRVPTSCGKTAIIAVFVWAHEQEIKIPTRLIYVVDRRLIVDSVTDYAWKLTKDENIIRVVKMRGGQTINDDWMMNPRKPTIIVSTVDQVGSRLLFRGYGVSLKTAPIYAGLIANDTLMVLDEAHISNPFATTLKSIRNFRKTGETPLQTILMTATPINSDLQDDMILDLSEHDKEHPVLKKRFTAIKKAKLKTASRENLPQAMVDAAKQMQNQTKGVVGVICNTTGNARKVFNALAGEKILLTGRIRPKDRDRIINMGIQNILCDPDSKNRADRTPMFIVSTQAIEVGADLDFDALVTQNAPIDSLRQRFGRLNRLGHLKECHAVIIQETLSKKDEKCFVYGKEILRDTFKWLESVQTGKGKNKGVDFGLFPMEEIITQMPPPMPEVDSGLPLTDLDLLKLRQTVPVAEIDIAPFLHGNQDNISVSIVWRADLEKGEERDWPEIVDVSRPVLQESMPCPIRSAISWLRNRPVLIWGRKQYSYADQIRPGDIVIIPSTYGGYDDWGWNPESKEIVEDIGNECGAVIRIIRNTNYIDTSDYMDTSNFNEDLLKLKEKGIEIQNPLFSYYLKGTLVLKQKKRGKKQKSVLLVDHSTGVFEKAQEISDDPVVHQAAKRHDDGKTDFKYQISTLGNTDQSKPLAKSSGDKNKALPDWIKVPTRKGWRHEINSLMDLAKDTPDLVKYLIATHHGYARTIMPFWGDKEFWQQAQGQSWGKLTDRLNEEYDPWGLAYLEAQLRLADWIQSRAEQEDEWVIN